MEFSLTEKIRRPGMLLAGICLWGAIVFCGINLAAAPAWAQTGSPDGPGLPTPVFTAGIADPLEDESAVPETTGATNAAKDGEKEDTPRTEDPAAETTAKTADGENKGENNAGETDTQNTTTVNEKKEKGVLVFLDGLQIVFDVQPALEKGRVLVPFRALFEALQAQVNWENTTKTVSVRKGNYNLKLTVNQQEALLNGETHTLEVPPLLLDNRVLVPLRFIGEFFGELQVNWDDVEKKVYLETGLARYRYIERKFTDQEKETGKEEETGLGINSLPNENDQAGVFTDDFSENDQHGNPRETDNEASPPKDPFVVGVHTVELSPSLQPKVALAQGQIGKATALHNYASYFQSPVAMINGTYFNPTGKYPDPYGTIITGGETVQTNNLGTTVGFTAEKEVRIADLDVEIKGIVLENDRIVHSWGAFGLNHTPSPEEPSLYIFTTVRGSNIGFDYGTAVIVDKEGNILDCVTNTDAFIPPGGCVITFTEYLQKEALQHFIKGRQVTYEIIFKDKKGDYVDWSDVQEAFTCWPLIIKDGQIVAPASKVPAIRSALALSPEGRIILISTTPATLGQLGTILQEDLGVAQAINLDGGGSAGLLLHGLTITKPSRPVPNALVFYRVNGTKEL